MDRNTDLQRFVDAHKRDYPTALREIRNGKKTSHWMWYIFPQAEGLGHSPTACFYAIHSIEEAKLFLHDPYLGEKPFGDMRCADAAEYKQCCGSIRLAGRYEAEILHDLIFVCGRG